MTSEWDIDEIRGINPLLPSQTKSQIDHLISVAATSENDLCELADYHEGLNEDRVICIFQLPFAFTEMSQSITLPTQEQGVFIEANFIPQYINCDLKGCVSVSPNSESEIEKIWQRNITRCIMTIPIWGKRADYYDAYQARVLPSGVKDEVIVPAHESWVMDRALKTKDYEYNLVRRMLREVLYSTRILLKAVRVTTLFHCDHDYHFSGMFWMTTPGRVTYTEPPRPIIGEILKSTDTAQRIIIPNLENAVLNRLREVTKFERALMSFEKVRCEGDPKAALIGLIAVVESVLKEKLGSKLNLVKILQDSRLEYLDQEDLELVDALRRTRNAIVHEYLTTEKETGRSYISKEDRAVLNKDLDQLCLNGIKAARNIFRQLNLKSR